MTVLVWPIGLAGLAVALGFSGGRHIWIPLAIGSGEIGLLVGFVHLAGASIVRRRRERFADRLTR